MCADGLASAADARGESDEDVEPGGSVRGHGPPGLRPGHARRCARRRVNLAAARLGGTARRIWIAEALAAWPTGRGHGDALVRAALRALRDRPGRHRRGPRTHLDLGRWYLRHGFHSARDDPRAPHGRSKPRGVLLDVRASRVYSTPQPTAARHSNRVQTFHGGKEDVYVATWRVTYKPAFAGPRQMLIRDVEADACRLEGTWHLGVAGMTSRRRQERFGRPSHRATFRAARRRYLRAP